MSQVFTLIRAFVDSQMSARALHKFLNNCKEIIVIDQKPFKPNLSVVNPTLDALQAQRLKDEKFSGQLALEGIGESLIFYPFCRSDSQTGYMISVYQTILPEGGSTLRPLPEKQIIIPSMGDLELDPKEILASPADQYHGRPDMNRYPCKYPEVEGLLEKSIAQLFFEMNYNLPSSKPSR